MNATAGFLLGCNVEKMRSHHAWDQCLRAAAGALLLLRAVVLPLSLIFYTTAGDKFVLV